MGATEEFKRKWPDHNMPRKMDRWRLPEAPMALALEIVTPADELERFEEVEKQPMLWVHPPAVGFIVVVSILIWPTGAGFEAPGAEDGAPGSSGVIGVVSTKLRSAVAIYVRYPLNDETRRTIDSTRAKLMARAPADLRLGSGDRLIVVGRREKGQRFFLDLGWGA